MSAAITSTPMSTSDLPSVTRLDAASAALAGAPDPAVIAQLANAFFSALPGGSVPSVGVAPPGLPGLQSGPTGGAVPPGAPTVPGIGHPISVLALPQVGPLAGAPTPPPVNPTGWPPAPEPSERDLRNLLGQLGGATALVPPERQTPPATAPTAPPDGSLYFTEGGRAQPALPNAPAAPSGISAPAISAPSGAPALPATPDLSLVPRGFDLAPPPLAAPPAQAPAFGTPASADAAPAYFLSESTSALPRAPAPAPKAEPQPLATELRPELVPDLGLPARPFDPHSVRRDFPILDQKVHGKPLIWLDNAATTQKPKAVIDRLSKFYATENSNIHRAAHTLAARSTDAYEAAREKVRRFVNAGSTEEIIFVRGATEGINLIAQSWGRANIGEGDEIVVTWLEHHANIVPWQQLAAAKGAKLRVAPVDDTGQIILEEYEKLLGPRTKLVSLTQVSNALGTVTPAAEMTAIAHRHGACVLVDGAQAVSHMPVDVQALACDFYIFSGHKVFGPTGIGAVWGRKAILESMPPWQGGGNMIADVTFEKTIYQPAPARFEAGTGNIADAVGLGAAIDYVERIGMATIANYEHLLLEYATNGLLTVPGLTLIGTAKEKAGVLSFVLDGFRTEEVGNALDQDGIAVRSGHHCAQPILRRFGLESTVRPSLALYNTCEDIDALVESLRRIQAGKGAA